MSVLFFIPCLILHSMFPPPPPSTSTAEISLTDAVQPSSLASTIPGSDMKDSSDPEFRHLSYSVLVLNEDSLTWELRDIGPRYSQAMHVFEVNDSFTEVLMFECKDIRNLHT